MEKLYFIKDILDEVGAFVKNVYLRDVAAIGAMYPAWLGYGSGVTNYLAVPELPLDSKGTQFDLPGGTIMGGDMSSFKPITSFDDPYFRENVTESIARSWYDGDWNRHPWEEETVPKHTEWTPEAKYSWVKAPRFGGKPTQVGPLAAVLVGVAAGHEPTKKYLTEAVGLASKLAGTQLGRPAPALDARPAPLPRRPLRRDVRRRAPPVGAAGRQHRQGRPRRSSTRRSSRRASSAASASTRRRAAPSRTGS